MQACVSYIMLLVITRLIGKDMVLYRAIFQLVKFSSSVLADHFMSSRSGISHGKYSPHKRLHTYAKLRKINAYVCKGYSPPNELRILML